MLLIVIGGLGFVTWDDIRTQNPPIPLQDAKQGNFVDNRLANPVARPSFLGGISSNAPIKTHPCFLLQSITPRTAGFNTVDLTGLTQALSPDIHPDAHWRPARLNRRCGKPVPGCTFVNRHVCFQTRPYHPCLGGA